MNIILLINIIIIIFFLKLNYIKILSFINLFLYNIFNIKLNQKNKNYL